jgi:hypothetical protein
LAQKLGGIDNQIRETVHDEVGQTMDQQSRRCNVIIKGLEESDDDKTLVNNMITEAMNLAVEFKGLERLGKKKTESNRFIKVELHNRNDWRKLLQNSKRLKTYEKQKDDGTLTKPFKEVFINPDQTKAQQEHSKLLREKVKELKDLDATGNFCIRRDKIVRLNEQGKEEEEILI